MIYLRLLAVALSSLWSHKMRTFLSTLGLIIGVAAVIAMLALGTGAKAHMTGQMQNMGTNMIVIRAGRMHFMGRSSGSVETLKIGNAEEILNRVDNIRMLAPLSQGQAQVKYLNQNTNTTICATTATYFPIRNFQIEQGRPLLDSDMGKRYAVLGSKVVEDLFINESAPGDTARSDAASGPAGMSPIGKIIKIKGITFVVIGTLKAKGDQGWFNPDNQIFIPLDIGMSQIIGTGSLREIDVMIDDLDQSPVTIDKMTALLRRLHRLRPDQDDDFEIRNVAEMVAMADEMANTFTYLLAGVAAISLIVGGIGIMNIMLVSVTERTREIGIRKALGARERDILFQFLVESLLVCILGGGIGVGFGVGASRIATNFLPFPTQVTLFSILIAFGFSAAIGIFFGYYPATQAAKLNPIEALRHE